MGLVTCPDCGNAVSEVAVACPQCGRPAMPQAVPVPPKPAGIGQDPVARLLLPVGRSWWAIAAGYLGLISVTLLPAPLALITGIVAVVDIQKHPERHGMGRAIFGIVMGALFSVLLIVLLLRG